MSFIEVVQYNPSSSSILSTRTFCKTSSSTSKVVSVPDFRELTLDSFISNPITEYFVANSRANGNPT
ncbi:hypothetical protein D3C80_1072360 [compost metagenome]